MVDKKRNHAVSELLDVQDSMLDGLSALAEYFGLKPVAGRIYGILLLSDRPLSLDEISDCLATSKSNISANLTTLLDLRMINRAHPVGIMAENRRNYYEAETNFQIVGEQLAKRKLTELKQFSAFTGESIRQLQFLQDNLEKDNRQPIGTILERINLIHSFLIVTAILAEYLVELLVETQFSDDL